MIQFLKRRFINILCLFVFFLIWFGLDTFLDLDWKMLCFGVFLLILLILPRFFVDFFNKKWQKLIISVACFCVSLFCLLILAYFMPVVYIGPKTTFILEPRTSNGQRIDYFRAISEQLEPQIQPQENGFRDLVEALGPAILFQLYYEMEAPNDFSKQLSLSKQPLSSKVFQHTKGPEREKEEAAFYWIELCRRLELNPNQKATLCYQEPCSYLQIIMDEKQQNVSLEISSQIEIDEANVENPFSAELESDNRTLTLSGTNESEKDESGVDESGVDGAGAKEQGVDHSISGKWANSAIKDESNFYYDQWNHLISHSWTQNDSLEMEIWIQDNSAALDLFCASVQKPFFFPMIRLSENQIIADIPHFSFNIFKSFVQGLQLRISHSLGRQDISAALSDLKAIVALADHQSRYEHSVIYLHSLISRAFVEAQIILDSQLLSANEIQTVSEIVAQLPIDYESERFLWTERLSSLDIVYGLFSLECLDWNELFDETDSNILPKKLEMLPFRFFQLSLIFEKTNNNYDRLSEALKTKKYPDFDSEAIIFADRTFPQEIGRIIKVGIMNIVPLSISEIKSFMLEYSVASPIMEQMRERLQINRELAQISCLLEFYRLEYQEYPENLDCLQKLNDKGHLLLSENYFENNESPTIPNDFYDRGKPYVYRRFSEAERISQRKSEDSLSDRNDSLFDDFPNYLLYSIGPNQLDEYGQLEIGYFPDAIFCWNKNDPSVHKKSDDISVRPISIYNR